MNILKITIYIFLIIMISFYAFQIGRFIVKKENRDLIDTQLNSKLKSSEFVGGSVEENLALKNFNKNAIILIGLIIVLHIVAII